MDKTDLISARNTTKLVLHLTERLSALFFISLCVAVCLGVCIGAWTIWSVFSFICFSAWTVISVSACVYVWLNVWLFEKLHFQGMSVQLSQHHPSPTPYPGSPRVNIYKYGLVIRSQIVFYLLTKVCYPALSRLSLPFITKLKTNFPTVVILVLWSGYLSVWLLWCFWWWRWLYMADEFVFYLC